MAARHCDIDRSKERIVNKSEAERLEALLNSEDETPVRITQDGRVVPLNEDRQDVAKALEDARNYMRQGLGALMEVSDEVARLQRLLDGRDKFIVDRGLWQDFVDQLPR
jgi:hypothetical protein